ncbi:MAG: formimidoylglutamate deiminase [Robiginitomaculum sp.]|nr:formimidoylglutamate deiminase [Robiginitomaculum sp.]
MGITKAGSVFGKQVLLADGWVDNVRLVWDATGHVTQIVPDTKQKPNEPRLDILLPGMANLHCHAFQRAMSGLAEIGTGGQDSFWTWREMMYRFVALLRPGQVQAIAAFAYMEMLQSGFTSVGEFHYLHHQADGTSYDNRTEMAQRFIASAAHTGIEMTLLPVFYAHSDFNGQAPKASQRRFVHDVDGFARLVDDCRAQNPKMTIGIAPHSLRAVTPDELHELLAANPTGPVHIHVAEQMAEVEAAKIHLSARPVRWLLEHAGVDERWCLVHATHMDEAEVLDLARSGAVAGLCPMTEANLGDGLFAGSTYLAANGAFGIGSDSCVRIDLAEELRWLEYGQRLRDQKRVRLAPANTSVGGHLYRQAAGNGAQALGQTGGIIAMGAPASFVALDADHPALVGRKYDACLDGWIFGGGASPVQDVWVLGRHLVQGKKHAHSDEITKAYTDVLTSLLSKITD